MTIDWNYVRSEIAEKLFGSVLDKAYSDGVRIGAEFASFKMGFAVSNQQTLTLTKTEKRGYDIAAERLEQVKPEIAEKTGAKL